MPTYAKLASGKAHGATIPKTRGVVPGVAINMPHTNRQQKTIARFNNVNVRWSVPTGERKLVKVGPRLPDMLKTLVEKFNN
jgi:hypothetical protein